MNPVVEDEAAFEAALREVVGLKEAAAGLASQNVRVVSCDEKTSIQALERLQRWPMGPGRPARQESWYRRHGTLCLTANMDLADGKLISPTIEETRTNVQFLGHVQRTVATDPGDRRVFMVDNLDTHKSPELVEWVASTCGVIEDLGKEFVRGHLRNRASRTEFLRRSNHRVRFVYTPKHCSWLNEIERWFSKLSRAVLRRGSFTSQADLKARLCAYNPWRRCLELASRALDEQVDGLVPAGDAQLLVLLAERAHRTKASAAAAGLLSLRFGLSRQTQALRAALTHNGLLLADTRCNTTMHAISAAELQRLREAVRDEWTRGELAEGTVAARTLLRVTDHAPQPRLFACDGSMAGIPVGAILAPGHPLRRVHSSAPVGDARQSSAIVSFADSLGDLPLTRTEVPESVPARRFVHHQATWAALRRLEACGLLHLGVHASRETGVATLQLADCAVTPAHIAALRLKGHPVVVLGGCGTAPRIGSERALAQAFRQAGASAVVATHWPMRDGELAIFIHRLLRLWPFLTPEGAVAHVSQQLRDEGQPPRLWGGLIVL